MWERMKRSKLARALALGLGCTIAFVLLVATNDTNNGQRIHNMVGSLLAVAFPSDSTGHVLGGTPEGDFASLWVDDKHRDRDMVLIQPSILSDQFLHIAGTPPSGCSAFPDSSGAVDTHGFQRLALLFYPTGGDSSLAVTYALQVRGHYAAVTDSQNTFTNWPVVRATSASSGNLNFQAPDSAGSLGAIYAYRLASMDTLAMLDETVVCLPVVSNPRGRLVFLNNRDGTPWRSSYTSLRIRPLNQYDASQNAWGTAYEQKARIRVDLVGWR